MHWRLALRGQHSTFLAVPHRICYIPSPVCKSEYLQYHGSLIRLPRHGADCMLHSLLAVLNLCSCYMYDSADLLAYRLNRLRILGTVPEAMLNGCLIRLSHTSKTMLSNLAYLRSAQGKRQFVSSWRLANLSSRRSCYWARRADRLALQTRPVQPSSTRRARTHSKSIRKRQRSKPYSSGLAKP